MEDGAQGRSRTTDTAIFSRMLYQLSYLGAVGAALDRAAGGADQPLCSGRNDRCLIPARYSRSGGSSSSSGGGPGTR